MLLHLPDILAEVSNALLEQALQICRVVYLRGVLGQLFADVHVVIKISGAELSWFLNLGLFRAELVNRRRYTLF